MLDVTTTTEPERTVVEVRGEIDAASCQELATALESAVDSDRDLVIGVSGVTFIDSSGLRTLLHAHQNLSDGAGLIVQGADATFKRLLDITGLDAVFTIVD
jgi:anti-anti-sigma factor